MRCSCYNWRVALSPERMVWVPPEHRPTIRWPHGARVALWVVPNVEHYEYLPLPDSHRNPWPRTPHPDVAQYSQRDYGNRVGFWRMLEVLDKHRVRCTVSLNVGVLEHYPEIGAAMSERDWAFMSHGIYNTRYLFEQSEDEEREFYRDTLGTIKRITGKDAKGMLGPALTTTVNTPDLMAEAGLVYHADWLNDDQPTPISVRSGKLISMPYTSELNDFPLMVYGAVEGAYFADIAKRQFDVLYEEGEASGKVMCLAIHPWLMGQPHRAKYLDEMLSYILSHDGVWQATADDIAEHYLAHHYDDAVAMARRFETEAT